MTGTDRNAPIGSWLLAGLCKLQKTKQMKMIIRICLVFTIAGCAHRELQVRPFQFTSQNCKTTFEKSFSVPLEEKLNKLSELYSLQCHMEVIHLGSAIREHSRDKFYHVSAETMELVTPEGTLTEYVLESYERAYLSVLISLSYLKLNQSQASVIELRRASLEQSAALYNSGEDRSVHLLLAALWDRLDPMFARPHWKRLSEMSLSDHQIKSMATARLREIDRAPSQKIFWQIEGFEFLPELTWSVNLLNVKRGPFDLDYKGAFPEACATQNVVMLPTVSWIEKLSHRHSPNYHPLLYTKSMTRFPVALGYGIVGATTGVAIGFGGCGLAAQAGSGGSDLCELSLQMGLELAKKSLNVMNYTMKPDLRHWKKMPKAISIVKPQTSSQDQCYETRARHVKTVEFVSQTEAFEIEAY